jgi:hypothetical protein
MKNRMCYVLALGISLSMSAQNETDVLRYSLTIPSGTARFISMGGAFGALGGDLSVAGTNPAGIGVYRKNEISFSPQLSFWKVNTSTGTAPANEANRVNFNFGNAGIVFSTEPKTPNWKNVNFGISYNRLNSYHQDITIKNEVPDTKSLLQFFNNQANGTTIDNLGSNFGFGSYLAYYTFLLDSLSGFSDQYVNRADTGVFYTGNTVDQTFISERIGRLGETNISFGSNYNDQLYLGAAIGIQGAFYRQNSITKERMLNTQITDLDEYTYSDNLETNGSGANLKLGAIYRYKFLRIGAAFHTPTSFAMTDNYDTKIESLFDDGARYDLASERGVFNYRVVTPSKTIVSLAFVISDKAIITTEYERANYASAKLKRDRNIEDSYDFSAENEAISKLFATSNIFKAGAEVRLNQISLRGGFNYATTPYQTKAVKNESTRITYSGGIGYREERYSIDLGYNFITWKEDFYPYDPQLAPLTTVKNTLSNFNLTFSYRY